MPAPLTLGVHLNQHSSRQKGDTHWRPTIQNLVTVTTCRLGFVQPCLTGTINELIRVPKRRTVSQMFSARDLIVAW